MKLSVNKEQIIEGLQKAAAIIPAKAGAAYLRSIWLKAEKECLRRCTLLVNIGGSSVSPTMPGNTF